jgi:hypothetical protein
MGYSFAFSTAPNPVHVNYYGKVIGLDYGGTKYCVSVDSGFGPNGAWAEGLCQTGFAGPMCPDIGSGSGYCEATFEALYDDCTDCAAEQNGQACI